MPISAKHTMTLLIAVPDESALESVNRAIGADDDAFVKTRMENGRLVIDIGSNSLHSLARAADDVLACLALALKTAKI